MAAIAKLLARRFPSTDTEAEVLKQIALFCGAGLFVSLVLMSYGLDLTLPLARSITMQCAGSAAMTGRLSTGNSREFNCRGRQLRRPLSALAASHTIRLTLGRGGKGGPFC
jgi:hypothetical protein